MRNRVLLRFLLAREQLKPAFDHIERLFKEEKWREAKEAIQKLALKLGIHMVGTYDASVSVHTEWFNTLDNDDKNIFMSFVQNLKAIADDVWPRAIGAPARAFEMMRIDNLFQRLRDDISAIEEMMRDESDAFKHGRFDIIPTKGVTSSSVAVETLDEAAKHIQGKFPQVLYGKVYIRNGLRPVGTYDARPGSGGMIAGAYQAATDTITLSMYATPERNSVMTLIHEFGHRYHTRFIKGDKREDFIRLSTIGDVQEDFFPLSEREKFADEWIARSKGFRDNESFGSDGPVHLSERAEKYFAGFPRDEFKAKVSPLNRKFEDKDDSVIPALKHALARAQFGGNLHVIQDKDNLAPVYASPYGETSWEENFAESFLAFCTGKALPQPLHKFMSSL